MQKELLDTLRSIDVSLQQLVAAKTGDRTTAFVNRKTIAARLGVSTAKIDALIHQGRVSNGQNGLVEGEHYCKLNPSDDNTSLFLFDAGKILQSAWQNFKNG